MTSLIVISSGESFDDIWPGLAAEAGFELRMLPELDDLPLASTSADPLVLVRAGSEESTEPAIHDARARGYPKPIVSGRERITAWRSAWLRSRRSREPAGRRAR